MAWFGAVESIRLKISRAILTLAWLLSLRGGRSAQNGRKFPLIRRYKRVCAIGVRLESDATRARMNVSVVQRLNT